MAAPISVVFTPKAKAKIRRAMASRPEAKAAPFRVADIAKPATVAITGAHPKPQAGTVEPTLAQGRAHALARLDPYARRETVKRAAYEKLSRNLNVVTAKRQAAALGYNIDERNWFTNLVTQPVEAAYHFPDTLVQAEEGLRKDIGSAAGGDFSFEHTQHGAAQLANSFAQMVLHPGANSGYLAMTLAGLRAPIGGIAESGIAASRVARAGYGKAAAVRAFRKPATLAVPERFGGYQEGAAQLDRGRLSNLADILTTPSRHVAVEAGAVQPLASPDVFTRAFEHVADRAAARNPAMAERTAALRLPYELERGKERALTPGIPLQKAKGKLSRRRGEQAAYSFLKRYGPDSAEQALGFLDTEVGFRQARLAGQEARLPERVAQRLTLARLERARGSIENPSPALERVLGLGRELTDRAQTSRVASGRLAADAAEAAVNYPARLMEGARYVPLREARREARSARRVARMAARREAIIGRQATRLEQTKGVEVTAAERQARGILAPHEQALRAARGDVQQAERFAGAANREADLASSARGRVADAAAVGDAAKGILLREQRLHEVATERFRNGEIGVGAYDRATARMERVQAAYDAHASALGRMRANEARGYKAANRQEQAAPMLRQALRGQGRAFRGRIYAAGQGAALVREAKAARLAEAKGLRGREASMGELKQAAQVEAARRLAEGGTIAGAEDITAGPLGQYEMVTNKRAGSLRLRNTFGGRKARNYVKQTTGTLYQQGRFRVGPSVTLEDFAREAKASVIDQQAALFEKFSKPLDPHHPEADSTGKLPGHDYYDPKAAVRPQIGEAYATPDSATPNEMAQILSSEREAMRNRVFPSNPSPENLRDLRQVPSRLARAFDLGPQTVRRSPAWQAVVSAVSNINELAKTLLIYAKIGFIPVNFLSDVGFNTFQAGPWAFKNLLKAGRTLGDLSAETIGRLRLESRSGAALSVAEHVHGPVTAATHKLAEGVNWAASGLTRPAALIHEYAKFGIETDAQFKALFKAADNGDSDAIRIVNQASEAGTKAIIDYSHLPVWMQGAVRKIIFILPWVYGSARYGFRFPLDHPVGAALVTLLGKEGTDDFYKRLGRVAAYLEQFSPVGQVEHKMGIDVQPGVNLASASAFGTGIDVSKSLLDTARSVLAGKAPDPSVLTPIQWTNPLIRGAVEAGTHVNTLTGERYPDTTSMRDILANSAGANAALPSLIRSLADPQAEVDQGASRMQNDPSKQPVYLPPATSREAIFDAVKKFSLGGLAVRDLNLGRAAADWEKQQLKGLDPKGKIRFRADRLVERTAATAKKAGIQFTPEARAAIKWQEERDAYRVDYKDFHHKSIMTRLDNLEADLNFLKNEKRIDPNEANALYAQAVAANADKTTRGEITSISSYLAATYMYAESLAELRNDFTAHNLDAPKGL